MKKKATTSRKRSKTAPKKSGGWVIGRERFSKISAVEGIVLTPGMKSRKSVMDRVGANAEKRREAIIKAYKR